MVAVDGVSREEANSKSWMGEEKPKIGVHSSLGLEVENKVKPTVFIRCLTASGAFTEEVARTPTPGLE